MPWRSGGCLPGRVSLFCAMWHVPAVTCAATRLLVICAMPVTTMSARATRLYCFCFSLAVCVARSERLGILFDCVLGGGFQGSRILPFRTPSRNGASKLLGCSFLVSWIARYWSQSTRRGRPMATVSLSAECVHLAEDGRTAAPRAQRQTFLVVCSSASKESLAPHSAKGRPLPSCLEVAAHQNQKGGRRATAPPLSSNRALVVSIFVSSHFHLFS